jgi:hypothetical protein
MIGNIGNVSAQQSYATPEEAAQALVASVKSGDRRTLTRALGKIGNKPDLQTLGLIQALERGRIPPLRGSKNVARTRSISSSGKTAFSRFPLFNRTIAGSLTQRRDETTFSVIVSRAMSRRRSKPAMPISKRKCSI